MFSIEDKCVLEVSDQERKRIGSFINEKLLICVNYFDELVMQKFVIRENENFFLKRLGA